MADFGLSLTVPLQEVWAQTCCFWEYLVQADGTESSRPTLLLDVEIWMAKVGVDSWAAQVLAGGSSGRLQPVTDGSPAGAMGSDLLLLGVFCPDRWHRKFETNTPLGCRDLGGQKSGLTAGRHKCLLEARVANFGLSLTDRKSVV